MKIYAIATKTSECYGHGDYWEAFKIEQVDAYHKEGKWNPMFVSRNTAQKFLDDMEWNHNKIIVEIELVETMEVAKK